MVAFAVKVTLVAMTTLPRFTPGVQFLIVVVALGVFSLTYKTYSAPDPYSYLFGDDT